MKCGLLAMHRAASCCASSRRPSCASLLESLSADPEVERWRHLLRYETISTHQPVQASSDPALASGTVERRLPGFPSDIDVMHVGDRTGDRVVIAESDRLVGSHSHPPAGSVVGA